MKKTYIEPSVIVAQIGTSTIICNSRRVTSNGLVDELGYGEMDEYGSMDPASRLRHRTVWDYDEEEEEEF